MNDSSELFAEIIKFDKDFIEKFAGESGVFLHNFISNANLNHDDLEFLFNDDHKCFFELLQLSKYAYDNNLNLSLEFLSNKIKNYNFRFENTSTPNFSQRYARLSTKKNEIRSSKIKWKFSSKFFIEKIFRIWNDVPSDINLFTSKSDLLLEISSLRKRELRYEKIRCKDLAGSVRSTIDTISKKEHHGYKCISLLVAACVLAKVNKINRYDQNYSPIIYPFFEFENISDLSVREEIQKAENFGCSCFDHYLILAPSFSNYEKSDDLKTLKSGDSTSFILGEKDGSCYFICDWKSL